MTAELAAEDPRRPARRRGAHGHLVGHLGDGGPRRRPDGAARFADHPMLKPQVRIVLRNCGIIDPEEIDHYLARGGYRGASSAVSRSAPEEVIDEVKRSGLRGRGGAGFPTWQKWQLCRRPPERPELPDLQRRRGRPRRLHEPLADRGRSPRRARGHADRRLTPSAPRTATSTAAPSTRWPSSGCGRPSPRCEELRPAGRAHPRLRLLLRHQDQGGRRRLCLRRGDGADRLDRGQARHAAHRARRFPPSRASGASRPIINNVETLATLPIILRNGADWYRRLRHREEQGHQDLRPGRQGAAAPGLIEVPLGITLRKIIYDIGGGISTASRSRPCRPAARRAAASGRGVPRHADRLRVAWPPPARSWAPAA